jgi:hypothetical protein
MRGGARLGGGARASAHFLALIMLLTTFLTFVPTASAVVTGDLSMVEGIEPMPGATYDRDSSSIYPTVKIKNDISNTHSPREIRWQICVGDHVVALACPSNSDSGFTTTGTIYGLQEEIVSFTNGNPFQPLMTGLHTVVFFFADVDNDPNDDRLAYTFDVASPLRDFSLNEIDFDDTAVYNSNTYYPISGDFYRRSWESNVNATFGWELLLNGSVIVTSQETSLPPPASDQHWIKAFPDFIAPYPGIFTLRAGLISSVGDMNEWNNMLSITINVNDSIDVWIETIEPARGYGNTIEVNGANLTLFPLGDDSIRVKLGNIGNLLVNASLSFSIFDLNDSLIDGPNSCNAWLAPGESATCIFDMPVEGELVLRADMVSLSEGDDINPSDNWYEVNVSSRHMPAYPTISNPTEAERFDSGDTIRFMSQVSQYAALPMNYTWRLNFEETIGYGPLVNTTLPMGEWLVTLSTRDANNNIETAFRTVIIQNRMPLNFEPWAVGGEAVMDEEVNYVFNEPGYPPEGFQYYDIQTAGLSPLRTIDIDFVPTDIEVEDPQMVFSDVWIKLTDIVPNSLPRESIVVYKMDSLELAQLHEFQLPNEFEIHSANDTLRIIDNEFSNGLYMIAGDLELANVSILNLTTAQLPRGALRLEWEPSGDLDNPYFGGWRIYRRLSYPFFWPYENASQFSSVLGTEVADLGAYESSWDDPSSLPDGICVSYLVMAVDRQGEPDHIHGAAAGWNGQSVDWQCGDAISPRTEIINFNHQVTFDNSSGQNLHHVNITWTWPEYGDEDNITWVLYRVELIPSDMTWVQPLQTELWGEPGTQGSFHEVEQPFLNSIKKERTYYYIFVPIDDVGNVDFAPLQANIEIVDVGNQFWEHNSYLIPEPPPEVPPPYGSEWLGELLDFWELSAFRTSATVAFVILLLNLVMIPVVINQTRGVRRRIKREKRKQKKLQESELAEDMADELEDIFN